MIALEVLRTEFSKLRRTKITWLSWLAVSMMPLMGGVFVWMVREPDRAERYGLLGQKAQMAGMTADWAGYFEILLQTVGIGGMILVAVIAAFVFGREYAENTVKNLLALPVARHWFALAKLVVVLVWFGLLVASMVIEALVVGTFLGLPGLTVDLALGAIGDIFTAALVAWLLVPVVAWVAEWGQGYLAPLGFTIFMLVVGMAIGATGWGKWFPWSIVPLFAGAAGPRTETLAPGSLAVLVVTFAVGVAATIAQLRYADNTQ